MYMHECIRLSLQDGSTTLMAASENGQVECVAMLLDRGAEVKLQNKVSGVIVHCVHAMQHISRIRSSE